MRAIKARELRKMYEGLGARECVGQLCEALEEGTLKPADFSLRDTFESMVTDRDGEVIGHEVVRRFDPRRSESGINLVEAGDVVNTSAFSNITGQIVYTTIKQAFENPAFLWPQLCTTVQTQLSGEKIPGLGEIGDKAGIVDEAEAYPTVGFGEDWIETPQTVKRGMIVPVTKEAIFFDRTGLVLDRANKVGEWLGVNKEKRVIDIAVGAVNNYKWRGTAYDTYQQSTPWINYHSDPLVDYTDIEAAELLWDAMTDPWTGEPILLSPERVLLIPSALAMTAGRILNSTQVVLVGNANGGTTYTDTYSPNPLQKGITVLTSPMVKARTSSAAKWFYGQPKKAFSYMENWGIQTQQATSNSEPEFTQDIVARYKVSERGVACVVEPRYMIYSAT